MYAALKLEVVGDTTSQRTKLAAGILRSAGMAPVAGLYKTARPQPWVAKIVGTNTKFGLERQFVKGRKDYSTASSSGQRGVMMHYLLEPGIYEIQEILSWSKSRRYFARSEAGRLVEIDREEVDRCLR
jgi:hypothetical protein